MKRLTIVPLAILLFLFLAVGAHAEQWSAINDELDIDYSKQIIRVFTIGKSALRSKEREPTANRKTFEYICTLTMGEDRKRLGDIFKARQPLGPKTKAIISKELKVLEDTNTDEGIVSYFTFDLNKLKPLLPDLNMPEPGDQ